LEILYNAFMTEEVMVYIYITNFISDF